MKKTILLFLLAFIGWSTANAQVGIGTTSPDPSSVLDVTSTEKGLLPPRMSTADRNAISSPAEGLTIFNITVGCLQWYNGTGWFNACDGSLSVPPGPTSDCVPGFIPPYLTASQTEIVDVTNPVTNRTWMDRNLGAYTADRTTPGPAGGTDCWAYGNLYQWGRASDGHEYRASGLTSTNATTAVPNAGNPSWDGLFITEPDSPFDWLSPQDDNLWQGLNGTNNPCPAGYRVPTEAELNAERLSWASDDDREGAITSPLKLPVAGYRFYGTGELLFAGSVGLYWSSTVEGNDSVYLYFLNGDADVTIFARANGISVRCLKD